MEYTKGDWKARQTEPGDYELASEVAGEHVNICCAYLVPIASADGKSSLGSVEANAQLISASPDLYEACKEARVYFDIIAMSNSEQALRGRLIKAIAKADGKSDDNNNRR